VIGRLEQVFNGADEYALPQMYESFENTLVARTKCHRAELLAILGQFFLAFLIIQTRYIGGIPRRISSNFLNRPM
jgi:hypothetical protein